jgi:pimeloyl-ACP methyl ester carboxylesterase
MTLLLIHGAWHGAWCWERLLPYLEQPNLRIIAPDLIGQGERASEATKETGLYTHIDQVVDLIEHEGLTDIVLVGHSYGGIIIAGVAEKVPGKIKQLIYLDALVPEHGQSEDDMSTSTNAVDLMDGWLVAPASPEVMGVTDPADVAWMNQKLVPIPHKCFVEPVTLTSDKTQQIPKAYIQTSHFPSIYANAERARQAGWLVRTIDDGHDAMVTKPKELAEVIQEILSLSDV